MKISKYLLKLLFKLKLFNQLPLFLKLFPKQHYKALSELMKRGYLDLACKIVKEYQNPKEHELLLIERVKDMEKVKNVGVEIEYKKKTFIDNINILFAVHNSLPYDKAGYAIRTHTIVTNLYKKGINLVVTTRAGYPWDINKHKHLDSLIKKDIIDNIKYIRLEDKNKTFKKGSDFNYIDTYAKELVKVAKQENSTIIHVSSNYLNGLAGLLAANELKIPFVYELRGLWHITRLSIDNSYRYNGMFEYEERMIKSVVFGADKVVTISKALKDLIVSWGVNENKIVIIPNGVDMSKFQIKDKSTKLMKQYGFENRIVIGFIGSLTAYEGLNYLIDAVEELIGEGFAISLMIVGDGKEKPKLEKQKKSKHIVFTGRVPHSDVREYYSIFDICIYPRTNDEVCRYVPPLKPLEAMAMKKAVIVSNVAPLMEMVEDKENGLVCKVEDKDNIKESIKLLYNNKELLNKLAINGYSWVKKNRDWNILSKKYLELYNSFKG